MRVGDVQLGAPYVDYTNTEAAIEALTGLVGGETAHASDTGNNGYYDNVASGWVWGAGAGITIPIVTSDPVSPTDGELWLLRETAGGHADGEGMGPLGLTYTGDTGTVAPLQLSVNDDGTTRRATFA